MKLRVLSCCRITPLPPFSIKREEVVKRLEAFHYVLTALFYIKNRDLKNKVQLILLHLCFLDSKLGTALNVCYQFIVPVLLKTTHSETCFGKGGEREGRFASQCIRTHNLRAQVKHSRVTTH